MTYEDVLKDVEEECENVCIDKECIYFKECCDCEGYFIKTALKNEVKYRWHNLLKDINDLPPIDERVELIFNVNNKNINQFGLLNTINEWVVNGFITQLSVIAWRYIEPFEVGE